MSANNSISLKEQFIQALEHKIISGELSVGDKIDNNMDDILCNDTDKTFVLDIDCEMIELAPGKSIYVDWFTDVYVAEIK